jgi:hypothetical protein
MALAWRSSNAANGGTAQVATLTPTLPTGWANNDLVYILMSIGANFTAPVDPAGWTCAYQTNSDSTGRTVFAYRTMQTGDTNPVFSWTTGGKWAYSTICIQPAAGQQAAHSGLSGPTVNATATSHTSPAFAAGALSGISVLMTGYRGSTNVATAISTTAPTNWTEPATLADTSTAAGTTAGTRQVASWHSYRVAQTGTITPGAQTASVTALANLYHAFAIEQAPVTNVSIPVPTRVFQYSALTRAHSW